MKQTERSKNLPTIPFKARLAGTVVTLPKNADAKIAKTNGQGKIPVEGTINRLPFRATLEQDGAGSRFLEVSKAMQTAIKIADSDMVTVEITRIADESETRVPADLSRALKTIPSARDSWVDITPMARRDWIFSICSAKQPETRTRRIEKAVDMLRSGKRRLCCFPGITWMMREYASTCGMWQPLANTRDILEK